MPQDVTGLWSLRRGREGQTYNALAPRNGRADKEHRCRRSLDLREEGRQHLGDDLDAVDRRPWDTHLPDGGRRSKGEGATGESRRFAPTPSPRFPTRRPAPRAQGPRRLSRAGSAATPARRREASRRPVPTRSVGTRNELYPPRRQANLRTIRRPIIRIPQSSSHRRVPALDTALCVCQKRDGDGRSTAR
jgi:hypothetical protein